MATINCRKCGREFTQSAYQAGNRIYSCLPCRQAYHSAYMKDYLARPGNLQKSADYHKKYRRDPVLRVRDEARWKLGREVRAGRIVRQPCEVCGAGKAHAHHDDYSKPLDVRWLCRPHHDAHHAAIAATHASTPPSS